ncbi:MAG: hypothetical protein K5931_09275 [Lachnospiraceae bacterium]|nr:hypothetical protein [Lachnospiraceae bacterium]
MKERVSQKKFVHALASHINCPDRDFLGSSLALMNTKEKRQIVIDYIQDHPDATKSDLEEVMLYISIGKYEKYINEHK